jgi:hypothetical protein
VTRRVLTAATVLIAADFIVGLITGGPSPLPLGSAARLPGLLLRGVLLAVLIVWRFGVLGPRTRERAAWLVLVLLLIPTAVQFQLAGGRIKGDGVMYYVYVRSLMKDGDLDFTNEYAHYELVDRADLAMLTDTGRRRSIFAAGPGVAWTPFFALGDAVARLQQAVTGAAVDLSGYGPHHANGVALAGIAYGFLTLALILSLLQRHFPIEIALAATLLLWGAGFLHWYMVQQPTMAHTSSAAGAALLVWLWDRARGRRGPWGFLVIGLVGGFAMCLRWQNGVLLVLPALELLERAWRREGVARLASSAALMGAGTLVGALPQMLAWKYIYGAYVLPHPPHGADFLRLDHPYFLQTLFSSRHGLLSWTPVFWLGFLGFAPLLRSRPRLAAPLLVPLIFMTYVNACSGDWWAGASFSNRRFDSQLAMFAVGFAASLEWLRRVLALRPTFAPAALVAALVLANAGGLDRVRHWVGSPTTWPASWLFALRYARPPGQYDRLVGRYLFYRQNNMKGRIDLGLPGDEVMLGEGWGPVEARAGVAGRGVVGSARMFAPLDVPEDLGVRVRASATVLGIDVVVRVNGQEAGRFRPATVWNEHEVAVPAAFWRRELNEIVIQAAAPGVAVDQVNFIRQPERSQS